MLILTSGMRNDNTFHFITIHTKHVLLVVLANVYIMLFRHANPTLTGPKVKLLCHTAENKDVFLSLRNAG